MPKKKSKAALRAPEVHMLAEALWAVYIKAQPETPFAKHIGAASLGDVDGFHAIAKKVLIDFARINAPRIDAQLDAEAACHQAKLDLEGERLFRRKSEEEVKSLKVVIRTLGMMSRGERVSDEAVLNAKRIQTAIEDSNR
jgi:hypothetical protein